MGWGERLIGGGGVVVQGLFIRTIGSTYTMGGYHDVTVIFLLLFQVEIPMFEVVRSRPLQRIESQYPTNIRGTTRKVTHFAHVQSPVVSFIPHTQHEVEESSWDTATVNHCFRPSSCMRFNNSIGEG